MSRLTRDGTAMNPSRETKFSGTYGNRGILIFPVQLTTCRVYMLLECKVSHTLDSDEHAEQGFETESLPHEREPCLFPAKLLVQDMVWAYGHPLRAQQPSLP